MSELAAAATRQVALPGPSSKNEAKLERRCACGQHTLAGGACDECRKKRLRPQPSAQRAASGERNPDRAGPRPHKGDRFAADPDAVLAELGSGHPLESGVRARMEAVFGRPLAGVRLHTDGTARRLAGDLQARAFTVGRHVAFGSGEPRAGMIGDALLAHEIAHVLQQDGGDEAQPSPGPAGAARHAGLSTYDDLEADADRTAVAGALSFLRLDAATDQTGSIGPRLRSGLRLQRCGTTRTAIPPVASRTAEPTAPAAEATTPAAGPGGSGAAGATGSCSSRSLAQTYTPTDQGITPRVEPDEFGSTSKLHAAMRYGAHRDDTAWHFCLTSLTVRLASIVQPLTFRTNIDDADDAAVTQQSYRQIKADLRPNRRVTFSPSCGGNRFSDQVSTYSRRRNYWRRQLVVDHEAFHRQDWNDSYRVELIQSERDVRAHSIPVADASTESEAIQRERRTLDALMAAAYQRTCQAYAPQQESRAYDDGAPDYQRLVDAVEARATREGWQQAPAAPAPQNP